MIIACAILFALLVKNEIVTLLVVLYIGIRAVMWLSGEIMNKGNYL